MSEQPPQVSAELARAQLERATSARIGTSRDRWIDGAAEIAFGLLWGGYFSFLVLGSDDLGLTELALIAASIAVAAGLYFWRQRATTVPRHSKRVRDTGFWGSLAIIFVLPFVPEPAVEQPWLSLLVAGLIAAPIVLAGVWILIRR